MYMQPSKTAIPIRKARAILAALTDAKDATILLNFHTPCAILVPLPHDGYLRAWQKARTRARLRTQFARLLMEALPQGR